MLLGTQKFLRLDLWINDFISCQAMRDKARAAVASMTVIYYSLGQETSCC